MLSKSKASPCIVTLILSFVLSSYINNLLRIKLKLCISNSGLSPNLKHKTINQRSALTYILVA